jgi:2-hydroxychromene-2-carboxylate isomerase
MTSPDAARSPIDFWFSIGSTYTYLAVMRIGAVAARTGASFRWRPFDVRAIMLEMNNIPFSTKPVKARYMWRDLQRRAAMYGIPWASIPPYPLKDLSLPNRVALVGCDEGWCPAYATASYRRWFIAGKDVSTEPIISASLREIGQDPERVLAIASSERSKAALKVQTDVARDLDIFGAPTFVIGSEIFWGDDRLDDAIAWHQSGTLAGPAIA